MKTAFKAGFLGVILATLPPVLGAQHFASAADLPAPPSPQALSSSSALPMPVEPGSQRVASVASVPSMATQAPSPSVTPVAASTAIDPGAGAAGKKPDAKETLQSVENKIPDTVKDAIKNLDKSTEDVTLDDLNTARQAVAKIEALIDIEKHLAELEKVRHEREKDSNSPMASMIPASALQAPVAMPQQPLGVQPADQQPMPMVMSRSSLEVSRIVGEDGHYAAVFKMMGGDETFHAGAKLPDGSKIVSITPMEVVLDRNGEKHTLHVKNVDAVYGRTF